MRQNLNQHLYFYCHIIIVRLPPVTHNPGSTTRCKAVLMPTEVAMKGEEVRAFMVAEERLGGGIRCHIVMGGEI